MQNETNSLYSCICTFENLLQLPCLFFWGFLFLDVYLGHAPQTQSLMNTFNSIQLPCQQTTKQCFDCKANHQYVLNLSNWFCTTRLGKRSPMLNYTAVTISWYSFPAVRFKLLHIQFVTPCELAETCI